MLRIQQSGGIFVFEITAVLSLIAILLNDDTSNYKTVKIAISNFSIIIDTITSVKITFFLFPLLEVHPNAWIFVLSFVFIGNLTILNLIIAILIDLLKTKDEN